MAPVTYELVRECLNNVTDAAGLWQIEGGQLWEQAPTGAKGKQVGYYSVTRRTSCGTAQQNTAMVWTTLFFLGAAPPENLTLHGSHDLGSGGEIGSVSAASPTHAALIDHQFKRVANTLTIA